MKCTVPFYLFPNASVLDKILCVRNAQRHFRGGGLFPLSPSIVPPKKVTYLNVENSRGTNSYLKHGKCL